MNRLFSKNSLRKWILTYLLVLLLGYFLFPASWGGVNGLLVAAKIATDPSFQTEMTKFIGEQPAEKDFWETLPAEKKSKIESLVKERFKRVNWLPIHLIVNFITFSILGFIVGIVLRDFMLVGIIPLLLLFITLPILKASDFLVHSRAVTLMIGITTQIVTVYLFSYLGYKLKEKRIHKKNERSA